MSSPDDPAIAVARRFQATYPLHDIELGVDTGVDGCNLKVSNYDQHGGALAMM